MSCRNAGAAQAQDVYDEINARTMRYEDFDISQLQESRQYFDISTPDLRTRPFDVLTTLVGLPLPGRLEQTLTRRLEAILSLLPTETRIYRVRPALRHWESHIIRRPGEPVPALPMNEIADLFSQAVSDVPSFEIACRGFFVSSDGTIAFQGYGPTADLRSSLRRSLAFSSLRQNETAHISVARILDPVGADSFKRLLDLRASSDTETLGTLPVRHVKLVSERRWYMEDYRVITVGSLKS